MRSARSWSRPPPPTHDFVTVKREEKRGEGRKEGRRDRKRQSGKRTMVNRRFTLTPILSKWVLLGFRLSKKVYSLLLDGGTSNRQG